MRVQANTALDTEMSDVSKCITPNLVEDWFGVSMGLSTVVDPHTGDGRCIGCAGGRGSGLCACPACRLCQ
jgi:hypothetical protein